MKPLENAIKKGLPDFDDRGFCLLYWSDNYYNHLQRMPIDVVDKMLFSQLGE